MRAWVLLALVCVAVALPEPTPEPSADDVPFCDEVDNHPSNGGSASEQLPPGLGDEEGEGDGIPNAKQHAAEIQALINDIINNGIAKAVARFSAAVSNKLQQLAALANRMRERQKEIDELFHVTLPSLETSLESRRDRAAVLREEIRAMNSKLRSLIDSLDRSSYVQEQQTFMAIIDGLMRIQNSIEMRALAATPSYRSTSSHPTASNALLAVDHTTHPEHLPAHASDDDAKMLDLMHALDLLEVDSSVASTLSKLPYHRRLALLTKRVSALLEKLVTKFTEMRQKHKDFAKSDREMWSKEVDILQKQSDELGSNLEAVMDQSQYYLATYEKNDRQLKKLTKEQHASLELYNTLRGRLHKLGEDFHKMSQLRAAQLKKLHEILHYLTYGNAPFTEDVFDFACDGVVGGSARVDLCGVCGGANATCMDCASIPNGPAEMDTSGTCGGFGKSCDYFCDNRENSGTIRDLCGQCGGNGTICRGCDDIPNSGVVLDACGVCAGDGSACGAEPSEDATPPTASPGESVVVLKCSLPVAFTPEWTARHASGVRGAFAQVTGVGPARVEILSAGGDTYIVLVVAVVVDETNAADVVTDLGASATDGRLVTSLRSHNVTVAEVNVLEGPTILEPTVPATTTTPMPTPPPTPAGDDVPEQSPEPTPEPTPEVTPEPTPDAGSSGAV